MDKLFLKSDKNWTFSYFLIQECGMFLFLWANIIYKIKSIIYVVYSVKILLIK